MPSDCMRIPLDRMHTVNPAKSVLKIMLMHIQIHICVVEYMNSASANINHAFPLHEKKNNSCLILKVVHSLCSFAGIACDLHT